MVFIELNSFAVNSRRRYAALICTLLCLAGGVSVSADGRAPSTLVPLNSLSDFNAPTANWSIAGGFTGDPRVESDLVPLPGQGLLVNRPTAQVKGHMFTAWSHADLELELDFLVPAGSNSGVYLQGRYEVQISDTWNKPRHTSHDMGGLYERWDDSRPEGKKGYEGVTPLVEVERAPGLWQHLCIIFRAPRFDANGRKTAQARFVRVELNGVLVHENKDVSGPTRAAGFDDEKPEGPLMLQGDHGAVAYRNFSYRKAITKNVPAAHAAEAVPVEKLRIEEGICETAGGTRVQAVAVGSPASVHYGYAPEGAALLRMWRGPFLAGATVSGPASTITPAGSTIVLGDWPVLAWLPDERAPWPDRAPVEAAGPRPMMKLDQAGHPIFSFKAGPRTGSDQLSARPDRRGLTRRIVTDELDRSQKPRAGAAWLLLAEAAVITPSKAGYVIGDREYYLDLPASTDWKVIVRKTGGRCQLMALVPEKASTLAYDLIW